MSDIELDIDDMIDDYSNSDDDLSSECSLLTESDYSDIEANLIELELESPINTQNELKNNSKDILTFPKLNKYERTN